MAKKKTEGDVQVSENENGSRVYELGFHLDPELPTEEVKKTYARIHDLIEGKGAIVAEGEPEKIQLAYTISRQEPNRRRDFNSAYFCWIAYETSVANHEEVLESMKEEKAVVRFIDLITTKDAARHAAELRTIARAESAAADEAESEEELDAAIEEAAA